MASRPPAGASASFEHVGDAPRRGRQRVPVGRPSAHDLLEQPREVADGQVGEPEQGHSVGGEYDVERPAGAAERGLHEPDELGVERGVELAIHLGGDEVLVEQRRGGGVGEALALHHVAPVTREVADGDEDQPILGPGAGDELRAPLAPVHGVVRVQPQVGRCGVRKGVGRLVCAARHARGDARGTQQADGDGDRGAPGHVASYSERNASRARKSSIASPVTGPT